MRIFPHGGGWDGRVLPFSPARRRPSTEEDARLQNGGQQPGAHVLGAGDEAQAENETGHEDELYKETQNLNFVKFLLHVSMLQPDFCEITQKIKFALFF